MENTRDKFRDYLQPLIILQKCCLTYLDEDNNTSHNFENLKNNMHFLQDPSRLKDFLRFISFVSLNHHRSIDFFSKIENVIRESRVYQEQLSNQEIFTLFRNNKRLLLFLYNEKYLEFDSFVIRNLLESETMIDYFYYELEPYIPQKVKDKIHVFSRDVFEKKRVDGGNDDLQNLIRNDLIEEFILYITTNNVPLNSKITISSFETDDFLPTRTPSLMQFVCFCGSVAIFKYLYMNGVRLTMVLWLYAIHGRNSEIIQILQDNNLKFPKDSSINCILEGIRCHHNEIVSFLDDGNRSPSANLALISTTLESYNFEMIMEYLTWEQKEIGYVLYFLCKSGYLELVSLLLQIQSLQVNMRVISIWYNL